MRSRKLTFSKAAGQARLARESALGAEVVADPVPYVTAGQEDGTTLHACSRVLTAENFIVGVLIYSPNYHSIILVYNRIRGNTHKKQR